MATDRIRSSSGGDRPTQHHLCACSKTRLIVIDEEHEQSFKQDTLPRYHARDVALHRAYLEEIPLVLGSATPSLESWRRTQLGQYRSPPCLAAFTIARCRMSRRSICVNRPTSRREDRYQDLSCKESMKPCKPASSHSVAQPSWFCNHDSMSILRRCRQLPQLRFAAHPSSRWQ